MDVVQIETPIGWFRAHAEDGVVREARFAETVGEVTDDPAVAEALVAYFDGDVDALDTIRVEARGTAFQRKVWDELRRIPAGKTASYADVARAIGHPGACRAVGMANASNPVGVIVPCHRVVRSDGTLGGYGFGVERKRWLLDHEQVRIRF